MIAATIGLPAPLALQLYDGEATKFPRAFVRNNSGTLLFTVNLSHVGKGLYLGQFTPPSVGYYHSTFAVYTTNSYAVEDFAYTLDSDSYRATNPVEVDAVTIANAVWDESVAGNVNVGSFGEIVNSTYQMTNSPTYGLNELLNQINVNEVKIDNMIAEINVNEAKLDTVQTSVLALSNNTTVRFVVPTQLIKPDSGTKTYQFHLRLTDELGNPEAPDSTPTIRIRNLNTGLNIVSGLAMTQDGVKVGAYYYSYSITSTSPTDHLLIEATVVENGVTRFIPATTEINEFGGDLNSIQSALISMDAKVTDTQTKVNSPVYGLSAIKTLLTTVNNNVLNLPILSQIIAELNLIKTSIKGTGNRDLTQVYDKIVNFVLPTTEVAKVWNYLMTNMTVVGSVGKLVKDYLNVAVSTRATPADLTAALVPIAKEATLNSALSMFITEINQNEVKLNTVITLLNMIKPQTDLIVSGGAKEVTLVGETNQLDSLINSLTLIANGIKAKTDILPVSSQIWSHPTRTLTSSVQIEPTQFSQLAKVSDALAYNNRISTVYREPNQELIIWTEKNNQRVIGTNCIVTVKDSDGVVQWTASSTTPNSDGIFKFINPMTVTTSNNYYVVISITVDGSPRVSQQSFFTVG